MLHDTRTTYDMERLILVLVSLSGMFVWHVGVCSYVYSTGLFDPQELLCQLVVSLRYLWL